MKKTIVFLVVLTMLVSMMPLGALAAEIGTVNLSVTAPAVNEAPAFQATCHHDNYVVDTTYKNSINGVFWYDETDKKELTESDRFVEGHQYTVSVVLTATSGNKFALDTSVGVHTAVSGSINDSSAKVALSKDSMVKIIVSKTFAIASKISSVSVTDIVAPTAGQKPEYKGTTEKGYQLVSDTLDNFQNGVYWYDLTESKLVKDTDTFTEGHIYRVFLCIRPENKEYEFAVLANGNPNVKASVNGNSANVLKYLNHPVDQMINVYYDFPACEKPTINHIEIEGITYPVAGQNPGYTATVKTQGLSVLQTNNAFSKNGVCWSNITENYDMSAKDYFFSNLPYSVSVTVRKESGFSFGDQLTATIDGKEAKVSVTGPDATISLEMRCPEYKIEKMGIKVDTPSIGKTPDYDIEFDEPNLYQLKSVDDVSWYVDDTLMAHDSQFVAGKNYDLSIYLSPTMSDWDYVAQFADKVSVTVNGNSVSERNIERISDTIVKIKYTFTAAASAKIGAVDIVGIDAPVAGKSPDYIGELANSDTYMIDTALTDKSTSKGISWRNVTDEKVMTVGIDKFEKGKVYEVMVTVTPQKGYEFVTKSDGTPDISGTINGKSATDIMGRSEYEAIVVYEFPMCEENAETPAEPETPVEPEKPQQPEKPTETEKPQSPQKTSFTDIAKGAYYYDAVMWAVENGITSGTSATTFSPEEICTRAQVVTFLWRMVASPEPALLDNPFLDVKSNAYYYKPVMWAVGSHITSGTSATTFSPNENCTRAQVATFLWRAAGQPKPKGQNNPFIDIKADSYYYDAVLWAVENGITSGTSANTFSPESNCTRAQVVTFLYRFINN